MRRPGARISTRAKMDLPPAHRAMYDRLRRVMGTQPMAEALGMSVSVVIQLDDGGRALPATVARVVERLDALRDLGREAG